MTEASAAKSSEHGPSRDERGRWQKGVSPNAGGRPKKDRDFAALAQQYLDSKDPERKAGRRQCLITALYEQGLAGNVQATRELLDRTYGKVAQRHEFDVDELVHRLQEERGLDAAGANVIAFRARQLAEGRA